MNTWKYIKNGESKKQLIGVEIEHFVLDDQNRSVFYSRCNNACIKDVLEDLACFYNEKIFETFNKQKYLVGLKASDAEISIEPGAQLEISIKACQEISEIEKIYLRRTNEIISVLKKYNYHIENTGYRPDYCALEVPLIPKTRYYYMDANFKNVGVCGCHMMRNTASTQISIDYKNEEDWAKKIKVATILSPIFYFLFDNSPIFEKSYVGEKIKSVNNMDMPKRMVRWKIWNNSDNDRCASFESIFDPTFSYERYCKKILDLEDIYKPANFKNNDEKIAHKLSMAFFDVRSKQTIEIRPADSMPIQFILSYAQLIKNLFYDKNNLNLLWKQFKNIKFLDYKQAGINLYNKGWDAEIYNMSISNLLEKIIKIAKPDIYNNLKPIENLIANKKCLKDIYKLEKINTNKTFFPISDTSEYTNFQKKWFIKNDNYLHSFTEKRQNSKVAYMNKISKTAYFSKVFDLNHQIQFQMIVSKTHKILEKICNEYQANESFRKLFKWDKFSEKLINFKPKYKTNIPVARFDIFLNDDTSEFQFCEFNTGGSAGMSKVDYACEEIKDTPTFNALQKYMLYKNKKLVKGNVYNVWVKQFIKIYKEWCENTNIVFYKNFNVAIVDFLDNCQLPDFYPFKTSFEKIGVNCTISDLRELKYKDGHLTTKDGVQIDAIYKRVTLDDLIIFKDDSGVQAMINAVFDHNVCPIDWFNSQVVHDKQIFAIIRQPEAQKLFTDSEKDFIKIHFPYTELLTELTVSKKIYIESKNEYLIKPLSSRDSKNVYVGKELSKENWKNVLLECSKNSNYIIQKFCKIYKSSNIKVDPDNASETASKGIRLFSNMEGLYCYNSIFGGMYLRQGDIEKDSTKFDMTVPVFYEEAQ